MKNQIEAIKKESLRIEEDATNTSKALYNDASMWNVIDGLLLVSATVASVVAGFTALEVFNWGNVTIVIASFTSAVLVAITKSLQPAHKSADCHQSGVLIQSLKDRTRIFRTIDLIEVDNVQVIKDRLEELDSERTELRKTCPQPTQIGRWRAHYGIENGESKYQEDSASS